MTKSLQRSRRQAFEKQGYRCYYCQLPIWEQSPDDFAARTGYPPRLSKHLRCTAEHLVAKHDGGSNAQDNIVAACLWCNTTRHKHRPRNAPDPKAYKLRVAKLVAKGRWHPVVANSQKLPSAQ